MLHREIDGFTDTHEATKEAKEIFRPHYRLYSGAFVDVAYDHFLAADENEFPGNSLWDFTQKVYADISEQQHWLPERFARMFPHMKKENWLYNYRSLPGISKSFGGLVYRAAYLSESDTAIKLFQEHYQLLLKCYRHFWLDVKPFAQQHFNIQLTRSL